MGYGLGVFLLALGLILALAVTDAISGVDLTMIGWILALAGVLVIALTAVRPTASRRSTAVTTPRRRQPRPSASAATKRPAAGRLTRDHQPGHPDARCRPRDSAYAGPVASLDRLPTDDH